MSPNAEQYRRQKERAKERRAQLIEALGGKCAVCGGTKDLEIDHVDGRDYYVRELSLHQRVARYWKEYEAGVRLRVLCKSHNSKDGAQRRWSDPAELRPVEGVPF